MAVTGSNSEQPQFIASSGNGSFSSNAPLIENSDAQIVVPDRTSWKNFFSYLGPGFLVSIAYIDPGNSTMDNIGGFLCCSHYPIHGSQSWGGKHLAEHCRNEYPKVTNFILWVLAEISIVACDIPEVIGTAFALNMLFKIPLWIGVLLTGFSTLVLLALQQYGVRKLEFLIAFLVLTIAACFFVELHYAKPDPKEVLKGLFVPQLKGNGATGLAISLLGAMVMPHNLFLHSALVLSRKIPRSVRGIREACSFYMMESGFALAVAFLINVSVISVSGTVCNSSNLNPEDQKSCEDLDLNKASFLLRNVLGSWSSKIFAVALLASGQSSTITGTYAGQYVMQGFLDLRLRPWIRNFLTRCLAIVPSLIVALIGGSAGAGRLIIIASISVVTWIIGSLIMAINIYYLMTGFINLLLHNHLPLAAVIFLGIFGFSGLGVYLAGIAYLVFRKNKKVTHLLSLTGPECQQRATNEQSNGSMYCLPREDIVCMQLPQRRSAEELE
ncbi:hypothetical protein F8388_024317 [Cannabis sativa]|uniref:Uncharacterized protein n=1 Tax=Cannabis sativa TaxID=3483 RepID=A0A7J6E5Q8_CANSA|nr:hypothetical protein F8388_024317 [Cannabis sativa]KAF4387686.1 hypothetical protein G4B88_004013 [Cannabis sativa]